MNKTLWTLAFVLWTAFASAQADLYVNLVDHGLGLTTATNRTVIVTGNSLPRGVSGGVVLQDRTRHTTDIEGGFWLSNAVVGVYFVDVIKPTFSTVPAERTTFYVLVTNTTGIVYARENIVANPGNTYPPDSVAWGAATSDRRYVNQNELTNLVNAISPGGSGVSTQAVVGIMQNNAVVTNNATTETTLNHNLRFGNVDQPGLVLNKRTTAEINSMSEVPSQGALVYDTTFERPMFAVFNDDWRPLVLLEDVNAATNTIRAEALVGTIDDARLPATITSDITGNATTATTASKVTPPGSASASLFYLLGNDDDGDGTMKRGPQYNGANSTMTGNVTGSSATVASVAGNAAEIAATMLTNGAAYFFAPTVSTTNVIFVASWGHNTNSGTIFKPVASLLQAQSLASAGYAVAVAGGTYTEATAIGKSGVSWWLDAEATVNGTWVLTNNTTITGLGIINGTICLTNATLKLEAERTAVLWNMSGATVRAMRPFVSTNLPAVWTGTSIIVESL